MRVSPVRFEHHREPFGIGEARPRLSWIIEINQPNWKQTQYQVERRSADSPIESTEIVSSDQSLLVEWPFAPLQSRDRAEIRVRVWGADQAEPSAWSAWSAVEAGLLSPEDWSAVMISPAIDDEREQIPPVHLLRATFDVEKEITGARLYATAQGVYDLEINGHPVGDKVLAPGWTSYHHRLRYQTYDVTSRLRAGANALGAQVGEGWFRGRMTLGSRAPQYLGQSGGTAGPARSGLHRWLDAPDRK